MNYRTLFLCAAVASGCGAKTIDLGGEDRSSGSSGGGGAGGGDATGVKLLDPGAEVFMAKQDSALALVVDSDRVYWYTALPLGPPLGPKTAWVRGCLKSACPQSTITYESFTVDTSQGGSNSPFLAMATSTTHFYWVLQTNSPASGLLQNVIHTCPRDGCGAGPTEVFKPSTGLSSLAVDDQYVYWTSPADSAILRCPVTGCTSPQTVALNQTYPSALAVDATHLYWIAGSLAASSRIMRAAKDGSDAKATVIADDQNQAASLALGTDAVYWTNSYSVGTVSRCALAGCAGAPTTLASGQSFPSAVVADGSSVYWINAKAQSIDQSGRGAVLGCATASCGPTPGALATGLNFWGPIDQTLALDATHVYWVAQGIQAQSGAFPNATIYRARR